MALALCASAPAAAGPFEKFFQAAGVDSETYVVVSKAPPRIIQSNDLATDVRRLLEDGYIAVGTSAFEGPPQNPKNATNQAKKVKAEIVLFSSSYKDTRSGAVPIMMPRNTSTTVNGNVYGSGGWGGFGGTVNTYGTAPVVMPISVDRYSQEAIYFSKLKPEKIGLGLRFSPLPPDQAKALGTNRAILVDVVIRNSPAFYSDIFPGDIILKVGGREVFSSELMSQIKRDFAGQTVPIEIMRDGQPRTLQITIPAVATVQATR